MRLDEIKLQILNLEALNDFAKQNTDGLFRTIKYALRNTKDDILLSLLGYEGNHQEKILHLIKTEIQKRS